MKRIPKRIAVFGSSSVHGTGDDEHGGFVHRLRMWHEANGERNRVYNLGIWGEDSESLISRIAGEARVRRPHLIIIYPGFNDLRRVGGPTEEHVTALAEFRGLMKELISEAKAVSDVLVLSGYRFDESRTTPYRNSDWFFLAKDAEQYTQCLQEACERQSVDLLDLWALDMEPHLSNDGLHCGPEGHQLICEEIKSYLLS